MEIRLLQIREANGSSFNSPASIAEFMSEEGKADRECFWVLHMDTRMRIIEKELVAVGTLDRATVHPREVFKKAILNSSHSIITVHNHPSGSAFPSEADLELWERLRAAGELLGIPVKDNLIITPSGEFYCEIARR